MLQRFRVFKHAARHTAHRLVPHLGLLAGRVAFFAPIIHVLDKSHTIFVIEGAAFEATLLIWHGVKHFKIGLRMARETTQ